MENRSGQWWRPLLDARWVVFLVVATVAVFSFIVSYSHIYDLGRVHAQSGTAARLLPLTVDLLIVASSLVLFIQDRPSLPAKSLAFWMPRLVLYAAIGATVAANVAYGLPSGWLAAVISGWPGVAFVAAVEVGILVARPGTSPAATGPVRVTEGRPPSAWLDDQILVLLARMSARSTAEALGVSKTRVETAKRRAALTAAEERSRGGQLHPAAAPAVTGVPAGENPRSLAGASPNGQAHG